MSSGPVLLDPEEWQTLSDGIAQRAHLLGRLLADLYGPQRCLLDGDLPSALVFDNPRFLRSVQGTLSSHDDWLPIYAVDLVRAPDGRFYVVDENTQAPAGMGYVFEHRGVVAQAMPDLLRLCNVEQLSYFSRTLRDHLEESASHNRDAPRMALLTPGPYSPTYLEQASLARHLGLSLVHGEDLAVRDDRVYLKTLGGLLTIDVLLRRVFDDFCDPLELRPDSTLGVPGLVQALRAGGIKLMNPLGTGLLETPSLLAYLPRLCRRLLKEELKLASVPTYDLANPVHLAKTFASFDNLVLRSNLPGEAADTTMVRGLGTSERAKLRDRILAEPRRYVAQRFFPYSRAPVWKSERIENRAMRLRCFAISRGQNRYEVLPSGLALVADAEAEETVSFRRGAWTKDVWVVSREPVVEPVRPRAAAPALVLSRGGSDLPSRVADHLYWLGRYTERAESTARLARVTGNKLLELSSTRSTPGRDEHERLTLTLLRLTDPPRFASSTPSALREKMPLEMEFVRAITSSSPEDSVLNCLGSALRVGKVVKDRLSTDTWRILASLEAVEEHLREGDEERLVAPLLDELNHVVITLASFGGLVMESMTRGHAWRFLDMGRRLERALSLVTLLRTTLVSPSVEERPLLDAVLDVADSGMTYRRRYPGHLQAPAVVDLLLSDDSNPRSVVFQLRILSEHVRALLPLLSSPLRSVQERMTLSMTTLIDLNDVETLCRLDEDTGSRTGLNDLLDRLISLLPELSDKLTEAYLSHAMAPRHLAHLNPLAPSRRVRDEGAT
ncbi:MAG: circularly permuted type 2 ATP-grasp protein [Polyangiaceae bacterium]